MASVVGQTAQRSLTLTEQHVRTFAELTGDYNPLHFDAEFAKATRFGGLVVQGGLRILAKIAAMNFASFARRPRLHATDHLLIGVRALTMRPSLPEQTRIA